MNEFVSNNIDNLVFIGSLLLFLMFILFPLEILISKILKTKTKKIHVLLLPTLLFLVIMIKNFQLEFILFFFIISFSFLIFLIGILSDSKYIYLLALISLVIVLAARIADFMDVADFFARTCYLLLILGVLKDLFYEKIFE